MHTPEPALEAPSARRPLPNRPALPGRGKRLLVKAWKWLLVILVAGALLYRVKFAPVPVIAHTLRSGPFVAEVMGTGTLEARVKTTISSRISERLEEVMVDQNDFVAAGQLLARLDESELKQQVEVATAGLNAARASLERIRTDQDRARAIGTQARLNHQRVAELMATKVISQDDLDRAVEGLHIAEADFRRTQASILEAEAQVLTAEKNLDQQKERLGFTRITSPYDGLIIHRDRDPGDVVVPGSSILQLISTNEIWVSAWVDETALAPLVAGQKSRVVFRSEPAVVYLGELARIGRETDRETREFLVDVRTEKLPQNWAVGQRAEVFIETSRREAALSLPLAFVAWRKGEPGVFLREKGKARWRAFQLGLRGINAVEVRAGLQAGDVVYRSADPAKQPLTGGRRMRGP